MLDDELEPHVDPQEPPTTVALLMGAASSTDTAVALDWARTMLDHLHTAPYHKPRELQALAAGCKAEPMLRHACAGVYGRMGY